MNVPKTFEEEYDNNPDVVRCHLSQRKLSKISKTDTQRPTWHAIILIGLFLLLLQLLKGFAFIERVNHTWQELNRGYEKASAWVSDLY